MTRKAPNWGWVVPLWIDWRDVSSNTKAKRCTGLGSAIAKQIVEMHGGRFWVESALGKGSTFLMELPTPAELRKLA